MRARTWTWSAVVAALMLAGSCGGSSPTPVTPPTPSSGPSATPPPTPAPSPSSTPNPLSCPLGQGTLNSSCSRTQPQLRNQVEAAIDQLAREQPQIFNLDDQQGPGGYLVRDPDAYYAGVVRNLTGMGLCANFDLHEIQVKNSNDFSEQYDILIANSHARRGEGAYRATCTPAIFPVDPSEFIDHVRVAFFGFRCLDGRTPPNNGLGQVPMNCIGFLTATAKTKDNVDVDPRLHGPDVAWRIHEGAENIKLEDDPNQAFNKNVVAVKPGKFVVCAKILEIEGCVDGLVTP